MQTPPGPSSRTASRSTTPNRHSTRPSTSRPGPSRSTSSRERMAEPRVAEVREQGPDQSPETAEAPSRHTRLLNRDFLLLWQAQGASGIGVAMAQVATVYWLLEETGSATVMGLVSMTAAIPGVLLGPFGGALADRYSRRMLIVAGNGLLGIAALCLGLAFVAVPGQVEFKIGALAAFGVLTGAANAVLRPAVMAAVPNLVPLVRLNTANAMNSFATMASNGIGNAIGGVLFRVIGAPMLFLSTGCTYLLAALSVAFLRMPQALPLAPPSLRSLMSAFMTDVAVGLRYVWGRKGLRNMVLAFAMLNFVTAPMAVLLPILLDQHRGLPPDWYGYLMGSMATGNVTGMIVAGVVRIDGPARTVTMLAALYSMAVCTFVIGVAESPYTLLVAHAVDGVFMGMMMVAFTTLMQATTPDRLRGRAMSVLMTLIMGTVPIAMGLAGVLADAVDQNVPLLFIGAGIAAGCIVTGMGSGKAFREFLGTRLYPER
ncbi:MAG: MFS transporter [Gammaproteobacteria bacterium]|nr:MFS transporter [Gammaproteobacteria bacterium]